VRLECRRIAIGGSCAIVVELRKHRWSNDSGGVNTRIVRNSRRSAFSAAVWRHCWLSLSEHRVISSTVYYERFLALRNRRHLAKGGVPYNPEACWSALRSRGSKIATSMRSVSTGTRSGRADTNGFIDSERSLKRWQRASTQCAGLDNVIRDEVASRNPFSTGPYISFRTVRVQFSAYH